MPKIKDYGPAKLSKDFFNKNPVKELSPQKFLYSKLLYPGIDELAAGVVKQITTRGEKEAKRIQKEKNPNALLKMMRQNPDSLNQPLLRKKILQFSKFTIPRIIQGLKDNKDDLFVEMAVEIIHESKIDVSSKLLRILNSIKDPYTLSLVCILLGFIGSKDALQPVWNFYHYFKEKYPQENYEQGPLLALYEFKERFNLMQAKFYGMKGKAALTGKWRVVQLPDLSEDYLTVQEIQKFKEIV